MWKIKIEHLSLEVYNNILKIKNLRGDSNMDKVVVFGSKHWPDCEPAKEYLSENNIKFLYLDISESMFNLKKFLDYRDTREEFDEIKKSGRVGLPCIVINDGEKIIFDYKEIQG